MAFFEQKALAFLQTAPFSSPQGHIHWNWQRPSSYPHPADQWEHHSGSKLKVTFWRVFLRDQFQLRTWFSVYLKQQIIDGSLDLQSEAVARIVLAESELVIDAEHGHSRDGCAGLSGLLVLLTSLQDFPLQLFQLRSERNQNWLQLLPSLQFPKPLHPFQGRRGAEAFRSYCWVKAGFPLNAASNNWLGKKLLPQCFHFRLCLFAHPKLISSSSLSFLRFSGQTSHPS